KALLAASTRLFHVSVTPFQMPIKKSTMLSNVDVTPLLIASHTFVIPVLIVSHAADVTETTLSHNPAKNSEICPQFFTIKKAAPARAVIAAAGIPTGPAMAAMAGPKVPAHDIMEPSDAANMPKTSNSGPMAAATAAIITMPC